MNNRKVNKFCCGKELYKGDRAAYRFGILMCKGCSDKHAAPFMAVYEEGELKTSGHWCGEIILTNPIPKGAQQ